MRAMVLVGLLSLVGMSALPVSAAAGGKAVRLKKDSWKRNTLSVTAVALNQDAAVRNAQRDAQAHAKTLGIELGDVARVKTAQGTAKVTFKIKKSNSLSAGEKKGSWKKDTITVTGIGLTDDIAVRNAQRDAQAHAKTLGIELADVVRAKIERGTAKLIFKMKPREAAVSHSGTQTYEQAFDPLGER